MTNPQDPFGPPGDQPPPPPGYGTPPPPPPPGYGETSPWDKPAPTPYGAPVPELASWGSRVGAGLIDGLLFAVPYFVGALLGGAIGGGIGALFTFLGFAGALAIAVWNLVQQGTTGQTIGKKQLGLRLVREADGQVVGTGLSIGRYFVHIVDGLPCYLGYFWPLWDAKKQTFADKILATLVIKG